MSTANPTSPGSDPPILPRGVWPVMLTPFAADGGIDWPALDRLVDWYLAAGVAGLFSVCLSSEMDALRADERLAVARRVVARCAGRVPVVASGTFGGAIADQTAEALAMGGTGVAAVVVIVNRLAAAGDGDEAWRAHLAELMARTGSLPLGLYECPEPYHRRLSAETLGWAAASGRFRFHKDTSCALAPIRAKLAAARAGDPRFRWFNAHGPSLLESLAAGGDGYSGIAANCFPELYVWLCANHRARPELARRVQRFLSVADPAVRARYPASAKRYLGALGLPIAERCRIAVAPSPANDDEALILGHLREAAAELAAVLTRAGATHDQDHATGILAMTAGVPLAQAHVVVYASPDPQRLHCYSPGICRLPSGRLVATYDLGGPGIDAVPGAKGEGEGRRWQGRVALSDDRGASWRQVASYPFLHARPFVAGSALYVLGHAGDLAIMRSDDAGETWSAPSALSRGQDWHQAPCNVHHANGCVYLAMERRVGAEIASWPVGELAPVLMRGRVDADLTRREHWTFASELPFNAVIDNRGDSPGLDGFGVPFFACPYPSGSQPSPGRECAPLGWLEANVARIVDPDHCWHDPSGRTLHLWMRAHTGGVGYACVAKVVEESPGAGAMITTVEVAPSGKRVLYVPCPGGQMKFHLLHDEPSGLYWLLSTQATDSMRRADRLPPDRYNLPNNERRRLQLHFSRNLVDWCFAGLVASGEAASAARHYASMAVDGDDLQVLSRSGDARAKSAHDGNLITLHTVRGFRALAY